jgi:hypothetical protein
VSSACSGLLGFILIWLTNRVVAMAMGTSASSGFNEKCSKMLSRVNGKQRRKRLQHQLWNTDRQAVKVGFK